MRTYSFDLLNRDGSIDTFEIGAFADDVEAAVRAKSALLSSLTAVAVEVWCDGKAVAIVRRDGAPPGAGAAGERRRWEPRAR